MSSTSLQAKNRAINPNFCGKKGLSGRKTMRASERRQRVIDKAWEIVERMLYDPMVSLKEKGKLAQDIVMKNIPQEHSGIPPTETKIILITPKERAVEGRPSVVQL